MSRYWILTVWFHSSCSTSASPEGITRLSINLQGWEISCCPCSKWNKTQAASQKPACQKPTCQQPATFINIPNCDHHIRTSWEQIPDSEPHANAEHKITAGYRPISDHLSKMTNQNFNMVHSLCTHGQSNSWRIGKVADHFKFLILHSVMYSAIKFTRS